MEDSEVNSSVPFLFNCFSRRQPRFFLFLFLFLLLLFLFCTGYIIGPVSFSLGEWRWAVSDLWRVWCFGFSFCAFAVLIRNWRRWRRPTPISSWTRRRRRRRVSWCRSGKPRAFSRNLFPLRKRRFGCFSDSNKSSILRFDNHCLQKRFFFLKKLISFCPFSLRFCFFLELLCVWFIVYYPTCALWRWFRVCSFLPN